MSRYRTLLIGMFAAVLCGGVFNTPSGPVSADVSTPAVAGGELIDVEVPIPGDCLLRAGSVPSACNFQVAVDADDVVVESHQENNGASGICTPAK